MRNFIYAVLSFSAMMGGLTGAIMAERESSNKRDNLLDKCWRMYKYAFVGATWQVSIPLLKLYEEPYVRISYYP